VKDEVEIQIRAIFNPIQNTQAESSYRTLSGLAKFNQTPTESSYQTLSGPAGLCPARLNIVQNLNFSQRLVPFELSIYNPSSPTARSPWPIDFTVLKAHFLHSKGITHSILEHPLQVLDLGFE
jgi:hypothetical protein